MWLSSNSGLLCLLLNKIIRQRPILHLVANCTSSMVIFPLKTDFPALGVFHQNAWQVCILDTICTSVLFHPLLSPLTLFDGGLPYTLY